MNNRIALLNKELKKLGREPIKVKTAEELRKEQNEKARNLPTEVKRTFWQAMMDGKNIKQAREIAGIDDGMVAAALVLQCYKKKYIPMSVDEIE